MPTPLHQNKNGSDCTQTPVPRALGFQLKRTCPLTTDPCLPGGEGSMEVHFRLAFRADEGFAAAVRSGSAGRFSLNWLFLSIGGDDNACSSCRGIFGTC